MTLWWCYWLPSTGIMRADMTDKQIYLQLVFNDKKFYYEFVATQIDLVWMSHDKQINISQHLFNFIKLQILCCTENIWFLIYLEICNEWQLRVRPTFITYLVQTPNFIICEKQYNIARFQADDARPLCKEILNMWNSLSANKQRKSMCSFLPC